MSKALGAICENNEVKYGDLAVADAVILSKGAGESEGVLLLDKDSAFYITSNASDIEDLIDALGEIVDKIVTIATGLDAASNSPGGATANITLLTTLKTQMLALKDGLK